MRNKNIKLIIIISVMVIIAFPVVMILRFFNDDRAVIKHELQKFVDDDDQAHEINQLIDNLTSEQSKEVRELFDSKGLSRINPAERSMSANLAFQEILNKNLINTAQMIDDTLPFETEYGKHEADGVLYIGFDMKTKKNLSERRIKLGYWGPDSVERDITGGFSTISKGNFKRFAITYDVPRVLDPLYRGNNEILAEIDRKAFDYIYNVGAGLYHHYNRRIKIVVYRYTPWLEDGKILYDTNNDFFNPIYSKRETDFDRLLKKSYKNPYFQKQACELGVKNNEEEYVLTCYGAIDSMVVKMELQHHIATGSIERSLEVAEKVWNSVNVEESILKTY